MFISSAEQLLSIMRKTLITIAAALLLCAVLCTAGCITISESDITTSESDATPSGSGAAASDPFVGEWSAADSIANGGTAVTTLHINSDNSGYFAYEEIEEDGSFKAKLEFTWEKKGDNTYLLVFLDESTDSCTLSEDTKQLTLEGTRCSYWTGRDLAGKTLEKTL